MNDTPATKADLKHLEDLMIDLIESLRREMQNGFDRIDLSVGRHGRIIVSGTFAISALTKSMTGLEEQMQARDREVRGLRERIDRLERNLKQRQGGETA